MLATESASTAQRIRERLGCSTIVFDPLVGGGFDASGIPGNRRLGAREIALIRESGITRIEIGGYGPPSQYDYRDSEQVKEIASACREEGVSIVAVHAPRLPFEPWYGWYEGVWEAVVREAVYSARIADELGASVFVAHFEPTEEEEKTVCEILGQLDGCEVKLTIENGRDLQDFADFVDRIGSDRFGITVDIGHTRDEDGVNPFIRKERAREPIALCGDRLFHLHLHDFVKRDHYPPFEGDIQWDEVFSALHAISYRGEYMFEANALYSVAYSLSSIASFPEEYVQRYGG